MKNKKIIAFILSVSVGLSLVGETCVYASVLQTEKGKFTADGNYDKNEDISLIVTKGTAELNVDNFSEALLYASQERSDVNGSYSHKFSLPSSSEDGEYIITTEGKSRKTSESFYYSNSGITQLYEQFTNANIWECAQMRVTDGRLQSVAAAQTSAKLRGGADNYLKNYKLRFKTKFMDLNMGDPWLQISLRTGCSAAENFIIRTGSVRRYSGGTEYNISGSGTWFMQKDADYNIEVECNELNMKITLLDDSGEMIYTGECEAQSAGYGGLSFSTSACAVSIDDVTVINTETENTILCEKNKSMKTGDKYKFRVYNDRDNIKWSIDDTAVATVTDDGTVTALKSGYTVLSITDDDGNILDKSPISVYNDVSSIDVSQENIKITEGESISVSCTLNGGSSSDLKWSSSDSNVAKLFGNSYTSKTITGLSAGTALITVTNSEATASAKIKVIVVPRQIPAGNEAAFEVSDTGRKISPYLFGIHHYYSDNSNAARSMLSDVGFDLMRSMKTASNWSFPITTELLKCPQMCVVPIQGKANDEVLAEIAEMKKAAGRQKLYIELGNEVYTDYVGAEEYMVRCKELYPLIKEQYPDIEIGAVIVPDSLKFALPGSKYAKWNDIVAKYPNCYDAVIVHNYTTINDVNGYSTKDMLRQLYLDNQFLKSRFSGYKELFAGKEIWVSEYGNLIMDVFNSADLSEQSRKSFAKTTEVAICNIEKLFDMAAEGIDISCYHMSNDAQGFGIIQGTDKLQNYYVFKKAGDILNNNGYFYNVSPIVCDTTNGYLHLVNNTFVDMDDIGAWGFGDENGAKYVVFSNRSDKNKKISIANKKIKKVWSYGGTGSNPLENYLTGRGILSDMPESVEQPIEYNADFENYIDINGYSLTVCEIKSSTDATAVCNVSGNWDFEIAGSPTIVVSNAAINENSFTLYCNGVEMPAKCNITQNIAQITPNEGWKYNAQYKIVCDDSVGGRVFEFTTIKEPIEKNYINKLSESQLHIGNWKSTNLNGEWRDFELTFDLNWSNTSEYLQINFRKGSIRIMKNSQNRYSYFNDDNDMCFGNFRAALGNNQENIKLVVSGNSARLYEKLSSDELYRFIGEVDNIQDVASAIGFYGPANCTITNLKVNAPEAISSIRIYQMCGDERISTNKILKGENFVDITIDKSTFDNDSKSIVGIFDGEKLEKVILPEKNSEEQYHFKYNSEKDSVSIKVFLWNSLNELVPLDKAYLID